MAGDGLFGFLHWGGDAPQAAPSISPYAPLEMRVRPRARVARRPNLGVPRVSTRDVQASQKDAYAKLNPANNPTWYLEDPSLRPGDIVVLKTGIMVFEGSKSAVHQERDFEPIAKADMISAAERQTMVKVSVANAN
jgi:hypothetical protein